MNTINSLVGNNRLGFEDAYWTTTLVSWMTFTPEYTDVQVEKSCCRRCSGTFSYHGSTAVHLVHCSQVFYFIFLLSFPLCPCFQVSFQPGYFYGTKWQTQRYKHGHKVYGKFGIFLIKTCFYPTSEGKMYLQVNPI